MVLRHVLQCAPTSSNTNGSRAAVISGVYAAAAMLRCMLPEENGETRRFREDCLRTISEVAVAHDLPYRIFVEQPL